VLTVRDRELVVWVARFGAVGTSDVLARFGLGRSAGYRRLAVVVDAGFVERVRLLYGQPGLLVITRRGLRFTGLEDLGLCRVSAAMFGHWAAVARLAAGLEAAGARVSSERELRAAERRAGELLASARVSRGGEERIHRPDLVLASPDGGGPTAVEVELTVKGSRRLEAICRGWARARHIEGVRYCATPRAARAVTRAVNATCTEDVIDVRLLPWATDRGEQS
jgi:hypothetical protein